MPLQKRPRAAGNSVFIDDALDPYDDQWTFLCSIKRMPQAAVDGIVRHAGQAGRIIGVRIASSDDDVEPWTLPPSRRRTDLKISGELPARLDMTLSDQIYISKEDVPPELCNCLIRLAAFQNPEFYKAQSMRLPTWGKPRIIGCAEDHPRHLALPRGCYEDVRTLLDDLKIEVSTYDERVCGEPIDLSFQGELRPEQKTAVRKLLEHDIGVLSATTAFGKTVVAAWMTAQRGVNTLVLVHRRQLLDQWIERLSEFLGIPKKRHRPHWRRPQEANRTNRRSHHPEPCAKRRREGLRRQLWSCDCRRVPSPVGTQF